jgi:hypothetical protein
MVMKNVIGYLAVKFAFIQCFIAFVETGIVSFLYKHFYAHTIILCKNSCKNIFRTGKQNVWFLKKTNLGKLRLCHTVFPWRVSQTGRRQGCSYFVSM